MSTAPGKRGGVTNLEHISEIIPWWGGRLIAKFSLPNFFNNINADSLQLNNPEEKKKLEEAVNVFESSFDNSK